MLQKSLNVQQHFHLLIHLKTVMQFITNILPSQVAGFYLKTSQVKDFLDGMNEFLTTFAHEKSAKENRISEGIDLREKELLEEENKQEEEVYKKVGPLYYFSLQLGSK